MKRIVVEIEFIIGTSWKIIRGIKPTTFEIWKNGDLLNQSAHLQMINRLGWN